MYFLILLIYQFFQLVNLKSVLHVHTSTYLLTEIYCDNNFTQEPSYKNKNSHACLFFLVIYVKHIVCCVKI